jgi:hypothetical protein
MPFVNPNRDIVDLLVAGIQAATLLAIFWYVIKTSQLARDTKRLADVTKDMADTNRMSAEASLKSANAAEETVKELIAARDQDIAPYVVAYFDAPYGKSIIHLVIKNIGKTVAHNVKLTFNPSLHSTTQGIELNTLAVITDGIGSLPPGHEIRTVFDSTISLFGNKNAPLIYKANISYFGGIQTGERGYELTLDLQVLKGLMFTHEKNVDDLVKQVEKLVSHWSGTNERLDDLLTGVREGLWLRNQEFIIRNVDSDKDTWTAHAISKLKQFRLFWLSNKQTQEFIPPSRIQSKCMFIAEQVSAIASNSPQSTPVEISESLDNIAAKLSELGHKSLYIGRESTNEFEESGDSIIESIEVVLKTLETENQAPQDSA